MAMETKEYLTPKEIAEILDVHEETVRRYIRIGDLPAIKLRGVYRVKREDFEKFLENRRTRSPK
ncbi:MAG TPA: DNA-binding protein [Anaerolineae bacterium]|nr:DNA-binding protein [Anaerolineae bacterium]